MSSKKSNYFPLRVNLNEVSQEPLEYTTSRKTGELNGALADLIGSEDYEVFLSLEKVGNAYLMKGDLKTSLPLTCSLCGGDYIHPIKSHFEELLVIQSPYQKGDQAAKNNHAHEWEANQPECIYLETQTAHLGELVHEQIALLEPFKPVGSVDPEHICEDLSQIKREWLTLGKEKSSLEEEKTNPFQVLEGLKLKS